MSTLLHLLNHLMRKLIAESEERSKKRFEETIDHKVEEVHWWLDAFKVRNLEEPTNYNDMNTFLTKLDNVRADVYSILAKPIVVL